jgi:hypothetical protein
VNGPLGYPYTDTLELFTATIDDIGEYIVTMTVNQDPVKGDGYTAPSLGTLDPITYTFKVTIDPCRIGRYSVDTVPTRLTYIIGDDAKTGGFYSFQED